MRIIDAVQHTHIDLTLQASSWVSKKSIKNTRLKPAFFGKAEEIMREKLASDIYSDAAEFVSEIILRTDEFDKLKLENLHQALRIGIEQLNRGEGRPLDISRINEEMDHASNLPTTINKNCFLR